MGRLKDLTQSTVLQPEKSRVPDPSSKQDMLGALAVPNLCSKWLLLHTLLYWPHVAGHSLDMAHPKAVGRTEAVSGSVGKELRGSIRKEFNATSFLRLGGYDDD
jgi:hypothetical protein